MHPADAQNTILISSALNLGIRPCHNLWTLNSSRFLGRSDPYRVAELYFILGGLKLYFLAG